MDTIQTSRSKILVQRETRSAYLFLLPSLVFFLGFVIFPMILCVYTSFFDATMGKNVADRFIGIQNYVELFSDGIFQKALKNTLIIVLVSVPAVAIFSLWVSSLIYKMKGPVAFHIQGYILSSCCYRIRCGNGGMEVDVPQLLRFI